MNLLQLAFGVFLPTLFVIITLRFGRKGSIGFLVFGLIIYICLGNITLDINQGLEESAATALATGKSMSEVSPGYSTSGLAVFILLMGYWCFLGFIWIFGICGLLIKKLKGNTSKL
jgi:hypothetical protein